MRKTIITSMMLCLGFYSLAQITITADDKIVTKLSCDMNDVKISMPLPSNYKGYDLINVIIDRHIPEIGEGAQVESGGFYREYSSAFFDGKKTVDISLVQSNGKSDLIRGGDYYSLSSACNEPMRNYTYIKNMVYIRGAKHIGYEWIDGNQVKTYSYDVLKTYSFDFTIGAINDFYLGALQKFKIGKVSYGDVEFDNYGSISNIEFKDSKPSKFESGTMDMGEAPPAPKVGSVIIRSELIKSSETTLEAVKSGVQFNLIREANESFTLNGYEIPFDHMPSHNVGHVYFPVAGGAKPLASGPKLKIGGLKSNSKADTKAEVDKILANQNDYFNWTSVTIDGVEFSKLELDVYEDTQVRSNDAWASELYKGEEGKTRKLVVLIGQKGEYIYCLAIFKKDVDGLTSSEEQFFVNAQSSFKFL